MANQEASEQSFLQRMLCSLGLPNKLLNFEQWRYHLSVKRVQVGEFDITYLEGGKGQPLLLLHGFGGDKVNWLRFSGELRKSCRVVVPDLPGFGESSRIKGVDYDVTTQADRIEAFRIALGIDQLHIAGNSMGGLIASVYAHRYPKSVLSLTLFDSSGIISPVATTFYDDVKAGRNPLVVHNRQDMQNLFAYVFVKRPYLPGIVYEYMYQMFLAQRHWNEALFKQLIPDAALLESLLAEIKVPILVIWGKDDKIFHPSATEVIKKLRPDAEIHVLAPCGHLPMAEKVAESARHVQNFLAKINAQGTQQKVAV